MTEEEYKPAGEEYVKMGPNGIERLPAPDAGPIEDESSKTFDNDCDGAPCSTGDYK